MFKTAQFAAKKAFVTTPQWRFAVARGVQSDTKSFLRSLQHTGGPREAYSKMVAHGAIREDPVQLHTIEMLQKLHEELSQYRPPEIAPPAPQKKSEEPGIFDKLFGKSKKEEKPKNVDGPQGLYMFGGVGCGKTFMMDLFYGCAPVTRKRRVHFHAFMLEVHARIHEFRQNGGHGDPIPYVTELLVKESVLLCFDEFMVIDIADAMILKRLFSALFARGAVVVATSNRPPDDLYKDGIQRESFLPFIDLLKKRCVVHRINSQTDYRLTGTATSKVYHAPLGPESQKGMLDIWGFLTDGHPVEPAKLTVLGHHIHINKTCRGIAHFHFDELCKRALGAADYLAISRQYHTVFLEGVPAMTLNERTEARRFITLVDALYEHRVKLIVSADATPWNLFSTKKHSSDIGKGEADADLMADAKGTLFTGEDEIFAFDRCASRLVEMQSSEYLEASHVSEVGGANSSPLPPIMDFADALR